MKSLHEIPVAGGMLTVGEWTPGHGSSPDLEHPECSGHTDDPVLAIHGISGTHVSWNTLARVSGGPGRGPARIIAPDLRGRGRSSDLPGPYGMAAHAHDLAAVLDHLEIDRVRVVGHSMGAFAALVFAHLYPRRVRDGLLIDGGLPLPPPPGASSEEMTAAILAPIEARLTAPVPSREGYLAAWKAHPAFEGLTDDLREYIEYDLLERGGKLWASGNYEAIRHDGETIATDPDLYAALNARAEAASGATSAGADSAGALSAAALPAPMKFLRAEAGMALGAPPLYPEGAARELGESFGVPISAVGGVNHYAIVMGEVGARAIAARLR